MRTITSNPFEQQKRSVSDDLICPITLELPWDPVHAMDGRLYEREAIETHISTNKSNLKSPMTRAKMGKSLMPAPHIKSLIEQLILNKQILGDLAEGWIEKRNKAEEEKEAMDALRKKAQDGDSEAMINLGTCYENGTYGFQKDPELAFNWYKKAHQAHNVKGTAYLGDAYCTGLGVTKCLEKGVLYYFKAAKKGSDFAACFLGTAYADGTHGFDKDIKMAKLWLCAALYHSNVMHLDDEDRDEAHAKLMGFVPVHEVG